RPPGQGHADLSVLQRVSKAAGNADAKLVSAREVFRRMTETHVEFAGLTHQGLGDKGAVVGAKKEGYFMSKYQFKHRFFKSENFKEEAARLDAWPFVDALKIKLDRDPTIGAVIPGGD